MYSLDNIATVVKAWSRAERKRIGNLEARGDHLFHYETVIATWDTTHTIVIVNVTKYSAHTTRVQEWLIEFLYDNSFAYATVKAIPQGGSSARLQDAYETQISPVVRRRIEESAA